MTALFLALFTASPVATPRLLVMPLGGSGLAAAEHAALNQVLVDALAGLGRYDVVGAAEIDAMLGAERLKDLLGCGDVTCAAEIARAFDGRYLATLSASRLADGVYLSAQILDLEKMRVASRASAEHAYDPALLADLARYLVRRLAGEAAELDANITAGARFRARLRWLVDSDIDCRSFAECADLLRDRIADVERVLTKTEWTPDLMDSRDALARRLGELRREQDTAEVAALSAPAAARRSPVNDRPPPDHEARLSAELDLLRRRLSEGAWGWFNRDERAALEQRAVHLERILSEATLARRDPARKVDDEVVRMIIDLEEARARLSTTAWTWFNRDDKSALEHRIVRLERTLAHARR